MPQHDWEDFRSKYGFSDGASIRAQDRAARAILVNVLNARPEMKAAGVRAITYDRPGLHNNCLIVTVCDGAGMTDEQLRTLWLGGIGGAALPSLNVAIDDLVREAYNATVPSGRG